MIMEIAVQQPEIHRPPGPGGMRERNSPKRLTHGRFGWAPTGSVEDSSDRTCRWIAGRLLRKRENGAGLTP